MAWTLTGFDLLAHQLPPRDHPQLTAWLNLLATDPHQAGTPHDHSQRWQAVGLHIAICTYEIDDKLGVVTCTSFYPGEDAWQAETS